MNSGMQGWCWWYDT